jgi:catechol 2,3-dioxygenase-like lactoylglutathione lyase family enzyme
MIKDDDMASGKIPGEAAAAVVFNMKLEVLVIPVSDVDRAKRFYGNLGFRLDIDYIVGADFRVIQFTPPGSGCSIILGKNVSTAPPGSMKGLHLIVSDVQAARDELLRRGIEISETFHDAGGVFHHAGTVGQLRGPNPQRKSYASYASFSDPDGNGWVLQEVTAKLTGYIDASDTSFTPELTNAVRHASAGAPSAPDTDNEPRVCDLDDSQRSVLAS